MKMSKLAGWLKAAVEEQVYQVDWPAGLTVEVMQAGYYLVVKVGPLNEEAQHDERKDDQ
jgi:hypothetical protein